MMDDGSTPSVLIALPHTLMRRGLMALLREARPGWICEDVDGLDALQDSILRTSPTLVLVELRLCALDGLRRLRAVFPHTTFVVLSDQDDRATVLSCLQGREKSRCSDEGGHQ